MLPYLIIAAPALASFALRKLTLMAAITAFLVAALIFLGAGYNGLAMLAAFFVLAVAATEWYDPEKQMVRYSLRTNNYLT